MPDLLVRFTKVAIVYIKSDSRYPVDKDGMRLVVEKILSSRRVVSEMMVSIMVVGKRKMKELNRTYHDEDYATDVLSFPYQDPQSNQDEGRFVVPAEERTVLGDIVMCYPVAMKQAVERNMRIDEVVNFLVEHGMLHLLGEHHE